VTVSMNQGEVEDIWPLVTIAERIGTDPDKLKNWANKSDTNGFPTPKKSLGRYNLYDLGEVREWYTYWQRITDTMRRSRA
jgi:hypothetical protein